MKKSIFSILLVLIFSAAVHGYELKKISAPLNIDGKADALWQTAPEINLFKWRSNKAAPLMPSKVRFLYDDANLYCLAEFIENNMNEALMQSTRHTRRDAPVYENDSCELFLDPFLDGRRSIQLAVDIHGSTADYLDGDPVRYRTAVSWNGFWRSAVHRTEDQWNVEYAIPWSTLETVPGKGRKIGVNISRSRRCNPPERSVAVDSYRLRSTPDFIRMSADIDPLPVTGSVEHGALFTGENTLTVYLNAIGRHAVNGVLHVTGSNSSGAAAFAEKIPVRIQPGRKLALPVRFKLETCGKINISANIMLDQKQTVFIGSSSASIQPPFDVNDPHPMVFQGENWGIYLRIFTPGAKTAASGILQNGKLAAGKDYGSLQGKNFITLPTEKLLPGAYTLLITVGSDRIDLPLTVIARP